MNALILSSFFAAAAYVSTILVGKVLLSSLDGRAEIRRVQAAFPILARLEGRFEVRLGDERVRLSAVQLDLAALRRKRATLEKLVADAQREAQSPLRFVGEESPDRHRFRAWLTNSQVQQLLAENRVHATLDSEWAQPQLVEVWAYNLQDARHEIQRHYPPPLGYVLLNLMLDERDAETLLAESA